MSASERDASALLTLRAVEAAVAANILIRCPHHPNELMSTGEDEGVKSGGDEKLRLRIREVVAGAPRFCPRCADEDE